MPSPFNSSLLSSPLTSAATADRAFSWKGSSRMIKHLSSAALVALLLTSCASSQGEKQNAEQSEGNQAEQLKASLKIAAATHESGDLEAAQRLYQRLIDAFPGDVEPRLGKASSEFDAGLYAEAKDSYEEALELDPGNLGARIGIGRSLLAVGKPEQAMAFFSAVHREQPENFWGLNGSAVTLDMLGKHRQAQDIYQIALRSFPSNQMVLSNQALSYSLSNQPQRAVSILTSLGPSSDLPPRVRQNLALAYGLVGNEDKAAETSRMDLEEGAVENNLSYFRSVKFSTAKHSRSGTGQTVPLTSLGSQSSVVVSGTTEAQGTAGRVTLSPQAVTVPLPVEAAPQGTPLRELLPQSSQLPLPESALQRLPHLSSGLEPAILLAGFTQCQDSGQAVQVDCYELAMR